jgi:hypothetical protein
VVFFGACMYIIRPGTPPSRLLQVLGAERATP